MAQAPKFIVTKDEDNKISWQLEAANGDITSTSQGTFTTPEATKANICSTIEDTIAASGISISLGTEFEPVIEYIGFAEDTPGPEEPYAEQETENQTDG